MLKTASSVINAIGSLNFKGTWDAATNTPNLITATSQKGDYYVVSVLELAIQAQGNLFWSED